MIPVLELLQVTYRCAWCGEPATGSSETSVRTHGLRGGEYGTPLCDACHIFNDRLYDMELTVRRGARLVEDSPLPQVGEIVKHKTAPWRGTGRVQASNGALIQVQWITGFIGWHTPADLIRKEAEPTFVLEGQPTEPLAVIGLQNHTYFLAPVIYS